MDIKTKCSEHSSRVLYKGTESAITIEWMFSIQTKQNDDFSWTKNINTALRRLV